MIDAKFTDERGTTIWPRMLRMHVAPRIGERITIAKVGDDTTPNMVAHFEVLSVSHKIFGQAPVNDHMLEIAVRPVG